MESSFESNLSQTSPRLRLIYELSPDGTLQTEFFFDAPGGELLSHAKGGVIRR
jgi:hypothetical protein